MDCEEGGLEIPGRVAGAGTQATEEIFHLCRLRCQHFEGTELIITDYMEKTAHQLGANLPMHQTYETPK